MHPPGACHRCACPLPPDWDGEVCPACRAPADTSRPAATPASVAATRTHSVAAPIPGATTAPAPAADTASRLYPGAPTGDPAAPPPRLPEPPPGYDLHRRLGGGGMGDVYLARHHVSERVVAMKFLRTPGNPTSADRFLTEIRALAKLDHPNIVRVLADDIYRAAPYFTMEYVDGGTLEKAVRDGGPLPPAEAARVMATVARAIAAAHAVGVLHRDLKPGNILLLGAIGTGQGAGQEGEEPSVASRPSPLARLAPKVSDFGLAKLTDRDDGLTQPTGGLGTPAYMPPEQVSRRHGPTGERSDVYGLGATLYHLLTGRPPFTGDSPADIMAAVVAGHPIRPRAVRPEVPLGLEAIVMKCLERRPADRYPTAAAVAEALDRFLAGKPDRNSPQLTRWRRARRWAGRNTTGLVAGLLAVAMLMCVFLLGGKPPPPVAALPPPAARPSAAPALPAPPAIVPQFTPDLTYDQASEGVRRGDRVVLVGPTAPRVPLAWGLGVGDVRDSAARDTRFAVHARGVVVLHLLPDPGVDRYRLRAEFRQDRRVRSAATQKDSPTAGVGLVVGHARFAAGAGTGHALIAVEFNEPEDGAAGRVGVTDVAALEFPLQALARHKHTGGQVPLAAAADPDGWRPLEVDVTPEGVTLRHGGRTVTRTASDLHGRLSVGVDALTRQAGVPDLAAPGWNPRLPLGIWAAESWVSVRNVWIEALAQPQE